jgi:hypothetical protein
MFYLFHSIGNSLHNLSFAVKAEYSLIPSFSFLAPGNRTSLNMSFQQECLGNHPKKGDRFKDQALKVSSFSLLL